MTGALLVPIGLQGLAMAVDEGWFHRRRGLPRWERIGHPLDTLTIVLCMAWLLVVSPGTSGALPVYIALAVISTVFVTKDEPVHARTCSAGEHWLHAVLFALHPIVLAAVALLWWTGHTTVIAVELGLALAFGAYQVVYWNVLRRDRPVETRAVNNAIYADLGATWYEADDNPVALLRAEARHRNPWVADTIASQLGPGAKTVLDLGCGGGFLTNALAVRGHAVTGVDMEADALAVARDHDPTGTVTYEVGDALALPYADASFDVVCAMDLIEHVEHPAQLVAEAARVLAPGGLLFFHTFNRTWQAHLIVIKGVEWFVRNTPKDLHVQRLFVTPEELAAMCKAGGLDVIELHGSRPRFDRPLWRMVATGRVGNDVTFTFTRSTKLGYTGVARKADPDAAAVTIPTSRPPPSTRYSSPGAR
jgi:2-polyprenyl-6-hydroxyphenyl methylase/3-demethylubiquinone-9 3-methyltransferase